MSKTTRMRARLASSPTSSYLEESANEGQADANSICAIPARPKQQRHGCFAHHESPSDEAARGSQISSRCNPHREDRRAKAYHCPYSQGEAAQRDGAGLAKRTGHGHETGKDGSNREPLCAREPFVIEEVAEERYEDDICADDRTKWPLRVRICSEAELHKQGCGGQRKATRERR